MTNGKNSSAQFHRHDEVVTHTLAQRRGVPYELERRVCTTCGRELGAKLLRRAAA